MRYKMDLENDFFDSIVDGYNFFDYRLYDGNKKNVRAGDLIEYTDSLNADKKVLVEVLEVYKYSTFKVLLDFLGIGGIERNNILKKLSTIYTKEEEKKCGVLGIKFKVKK